MNINSINNLLLNIASVLNKAIPKVDVRVEFTNKSFYLKNVFKSQHTKRALISYITDPFKEGLKFHHTNYLECYTAAQILHEMGYVVDVVDYSSKLKPDFKLYEIVYGFGFPFETSFYDNSFKGKRIIYSPGCNTVYSNIVSSLRLKPMMEKLGYYAGNLSRVTNNAWPLQKYLSDAIICLGNVFVKGTYQKENPHMAIYSLDVFYLSSQKEIDVTQKHYNEARLQLIWFGSQGSVHKGLDIALEILLLNPTLTLHICGYDNRNEPELTTIYKNLFESGRAINHGFVDVNSDVFAGLMLKCGAVIFPSASEGGAASLLTLMANGGLIPIITQQCGLSLGNMAFEAEEPTIAAVNKQVQQYLAISSVELQERAIKLQCQIKEKHNYNLYRTQLLGIINNIISG